MDPLITNPFAVLTFIAAPAILTNASSVMALGTSNRFARAVDRARALAAELESGELPQDVFQRKLKLLDYARRRTLLLVRALTTFYLSLGGFAGASFSSLIGSVFVITHHDLPRHAAITVACACGVLAVGSLMTGSAILVYETRLTHAILTEETELLLQRIAVHRTGQASAVVEPKRDGERAAR